jgi:hypothetical protein
LLGHHELGVHAIEQRHIIDIAQRDWRHLANDAPQQVEHESTARWWWAGTAPARVFPTFSWASSVTGLRINKPV